MNKYTGETPIEIGGVEYKLVYNWKALADISAKHGADAFKNADPSVVADILVAGLKKQHPEVTKDMILDLSPPLIPVIEAIGRAVNVAYFGTQEAPEGQAGEETEKKI